METGSVSFVRGKAGNVPAQLGSLEGASFKHWTSDRTNLSFLTSNDSTDQVSETLCLKKLKIVDNAKNSKQSDVYAVTEESLAGVNLP